MALYERQALKVIRTGCSLPGTGGEGARQDVVDQAHGANGVLIVVADGHDDTGAGGKAARLVVDTILDTFRTWDGTAPRKMLVEAMGMANAALRRKAERERDLADLAVSVAMLHYHEGAVRIAHVGNCRAYRQRNYVIDQLTVDHVQGGYDDGPPVLERGIGLYQIVEVDISDAHFVQPGEVFLLCTDGVTRVMSDLEIGRHILAGEPATACGSLASRAAAAAGGESVSLTLVKFVAPEPRRLATTTQPTPQLMHADGPSRAMMSWRRLDGWWKFRLIALALLVVWFLALLVVWWHNGPAVAAGIFPILAAVPRCRRTRAGGRS